MGSCVYLWERIRDQTTVEAKACLQSIIFAEDLGFKRACVEGDVLTAIKKLKMEGNYRSYIGNIINEIKDMLSRFETLTLRHVPRTANEAEHGLNSGRYIAVALPSKIAFAENSGVKWSHTNSGGLQPQFN
ncbi:hypothetical protein Golax_003303, partial [Gossypium laxum]|nr:hypothetical protein [Gossypium laxum]